VYGLAVVAYELLTGARPFERESATAEAAAHANEPVPLASAREPDLPRTVDEVFERSLAKDPEDRHETAGEFVQDLRAALVAGEEMTRAMPVPAPPAAARPSRPARRLLPYVLAALLLAGGIAAAAALTAASGGDEKADRATTVVRQRTVIKRGKPVVRRVTVTETTPATPPPPPPPPPPISPPPASPPPPAASDGHALNDEGFALMQEGRYSEALPLLQQAVRALRGTYTSSDRYEAYADYNLGYTLLQLGRCSEALPYLDRSERLQGYRAEIDEAQAAAQECLGGGGSGNGKGKAKGKEKDEG
jgi:tetratricopeptide (TPR) repeat protein